jgi:AraC-like DNA-binding protein
VEHVEQVVEHVLLTMRQRLGEQLTLDDLAKTARFSKFYFARMFRQVTGMSPRRFLYAIRLQEAKRLLVVSSHSVADISHQVGYHSVGTFTSRFTASVGVPPAEYRRLRGNVSAVLRAEPLDPAAAGIITGWIEEPEQGAAGVATVVGLFPGPVPEGRPARCDVLGGYGDWALKNVPTGRWYVLIVPFWSAARTGTSAGVRAVCPTGEGKPMLMSISGPVWVGPDVPTAHVTVRLRPMRAIDPPILAGLAGPYC